MIETIEYKKIPATIMHRITGDIDLDEVKCGIDEANEPINKIIDKYGRFNLIIDLRGISFTDLAAHKMWKIWSQSRLITEKANYIAIVLVYSPHTKAERELMETEAFFLLAYSILAMPSIGMLLLPGAIFFLTGAVFKTKKARKAVILEK